MTAEIDRIAGTAQLLVALDFDGTLSPHTPEPMEARMLPAARAALDLLFGLPHTTVALVSGRSLVDLRIIAEHRDDSRILLVGSHGAEAWIPGEGRIADEDDPDDFALRDRAQAEAEAAVADLDGAWIEPKTYGIGVHTRRCTPADAHETYRRVDAIVDRLAPGWRRRTGNATVEFSFRHEGKDTALTKLRARTGATAVFFAGDDVTDEDGLRILAGDDLGVHVGSGQTAASVSVPDIAALAALLAELAVARAARVGVSAQE